MDTKYKTCKPRILILSPQAHNLLKVIESFGGYNTNDSGHNKVSAEGFNTITSLVFSFPSSTVKLALELKAQEPHLYIYQKNTKGQLVEDLVPSLKNLYSVKDLFPQFDPKNPTHLKHHSGISNLHPSEDQKVIRLKSFGDTNLLKEILSAFKLYSSSSMQKKSEKELSPEELIKKLEHQSEIGARGEELLFERLKAQLIALKVTEADIPKHLIHTSKIDASKGYDIEYHFKDEHRYIEVKTTTTTVDAEFFFSINEYEVLEAKGKEGYIYRVVLSPDLEKIVDLKEIKNPFADKGTSDFKAIAFKANLKDFEK